VVQSLFCELSDETLEERGFSHSGRTDNSHYDWGRIILRCAIDKGYVKARLVSFCGPSGPPVRSASRFRSKCLGKRRSNRDETRGDGHTFSLKPVGTPSPPIFFSTSDLPRLDRCGLCICSIRSTTERVIEKEWVPHVIVKRNFRFCSMCTGTSGKV
jgi:hypothetical protein